MPSRYLLIFPFLFSLNLGLLENFISLNDLVRENRIYYYEKGSKAVSGPVKTFWANGFVENKGSLKAGKKEGKWLVYSDNGSLSKKHSGFFKNNIKINN